LNTHSRRLLFAQVLSIAGFLLFPLRFSFPAPHAEGVFGVLFSTLYSFDKPYNQAPSLHLSITVLLWSEYSRRLHGVWLWLMRAWMILVAFSTLTTFQHHFIDLPTGVWVGLVAIVLFPFVPAAMPAPSRDPARFRIAAIYVTGAVLAAAAAAGLGGAVWLLLWPSAALLLVAMTYVCGRPDWFRKAGGEISLPAMAVFGPYLAGAWLNYLWWSRRETASHEIVPGIRLGRLPLPSECQHPGIASMVDLAAEVPVDPAGVAYRAVPMLDRLAPEAAHLDAAVAAIRELETQRPTLVCCALGYSRSAAAVAAWLLSTGAAATVDDALEMIRAWRPRVVLSRADRDRLAQWRRANLLRLSSSAPSCSLPGIHPKTIGAQMGENRSWSQRPR
jgi:protein-tyrosine phosphatase